MQAQYVAVADLLAYGIRVQLHGAFCFIMAVRAVLPGDGVRFGVICSWTKERALAMRRQGVVPQMVRRPTRSRLLACEAKVGKCPVRTWVGQRGVWYCVLREGWAWCGDHIVPYHSCTKTAVLASSMLLDLVDWLKLRKCLLLLYMGLGDTFGSVDDHGVEPRIDTQSVMKHASVAPAIAVWSVLKTSGVGWVS